MFQPTLFDAAVQGPEIPGLRYISDFITPAEEKDLLGKIDAGVWLTDLKRRVQHYGYKYDYKARRIDVQMRLGALPDWIAAVALKIHASGCFENHIPDQVIVNEYEPGQGIAPHIDCEPCFTDTIVSLSLQSAAIMEFSKGGETIPYLLKPRSIVVLTGEARYDWTHAIPPRKKDNFQGLVCLRKRRISLTFRKVIV
jgi:alkylated DNA repair dioxygenase AlkB